MKGKKRKRNRSTYHENFMVYNSFRKISQLTIFTSGVF